MNELATSEARPVGTPSRMGRCAYCGAPLAAEFYFCRVCGTPHCDPESVLPPARPAPLTTGMLIERKAPYVKGLFWTYFAVVVTVGVGASVLLGDRDLYLALIVQSAALFVTTCIFAARHWRALAVQLKRTGALSWATWAAVGILAPLLGVNYVYHRWLMGLLGERGIDLVAQMRQDGLGEGAVIVFICVLPGFLEEIAFRGLVQHWLQVAVRPALAIVLASALFTAMHFSILSAPYLFVVGLLLGWTKYKTGSLWPSMLVHFLHNLIVVEVLSR